MMKNWDKIEEAVKVISLLLTIIAFFVIIILGIIGVISGQKCLQWVAGDVLIFLAILFVVAIDEFSSNGHKSTSSSSYYGDMGSSDSLLEIGNDIDDYNERVFSGE